MFHPTLKPLFYRLLKTVPNRFRHVLLGFSMLSMHPVFLNDSMAPNVSKWFEMCHHVRQIGSAWLQMCSNVLPCTPDYKIWLPDCYFSTLATCTCKDWRTPPHPSPLSAPQVEIHLRGLHIVGPRTSTWACLGIYMHCQAIDMGIHGHHHDIQHSNRRALVVSVNMSRGWVLPSTKGNVSTWQLAWSATFQSAIV